MKFMWPKSWFKKMISKRGTETDTNIPIYKSRLSCARCGEFKHTPIRRDPDGYICAGCLVQECDALKERAERAELQRDGYKEMSESQFNAAEEARTKLAEAQSEIDNFYVTQEQLRTQWETKLSEAERKYSEIAEMMNKDTEAIMNVSTVEAKLKEAEQSNAVLREALEELYNHCKYEKWTHGTSVVEDDIISRVIAALSYTPNPNLIVVEKEKWERVNNICDELANTVEVIGSQNHNLECPNCRVCEAVDKALANYNAFRKGAL